MLFLFWNWSQGKLFWTTEEEQEHEQMSFPITTTEKRCGMIRERTMGMCQCWMLSLGLLAEWDAVWFSSDVFVLFSSKKQHQNYSMPICSSFSISAIESSNTLFLALIKFVTYSVLMQCDAFQLGSHKECVSTKRKKGHMTRFLSLSLFNDVGEVTRHLQTIATHIHTSSWILLVVIVVVVDEHFFLSRFDWSFFDADEDHVTDYSLMMLINSSFFYYSTWSKRKKKKTRWCQKWERKENEEGERERKDDLYSITYHNAYSSNKENRFCNDDALFVACELTKEKFDAEWIWIYLSFLFFSFPFPSRSLSLSLSLFLCVSLRLALLSIERNERKRENDSCQQ